MDKINIDMLTQDSVSIKKQQYTLIDGKDFPIGDPWRKAYLNSIQGRLDVELEIPDPCKSAIFKIWGDAPTVL